MSIPCYDLRSMRKILMTLLFALWIGPGCAHASADHGFQAAQSGLATADVLIDAMVDAYKLAVDQLQRHCVGSLDKHACEAEYRVSAADVDKTIRAYEKVRDAYDLTAASAAELQTAYGELEPRLPDVVEQARELAQ